MSEELIARDEYLVEAAAYTAVGLMRWPGLFWLKVVEAVFAYD